MEHLLRQYPGSSQSVDDFCAAHGLSKHQYHYWRRKFGLNFRNSRAVRAKQNGFVKVSLSEQRITRQFSFGSSSYLFHFPDGRKLEIPMSFDPASLQTLFSLLTR